MITTQESPKSLFYKRQSPDIDSEHLNKFGSFLYSNTFVASRPVSPTEYDVAAGHTEQDETSQNLDQVLKTLCEFEVIVLNLKRVGRFPFVVGPSETEHDEYQGLFKL
jgi:hypothetical protein